MKAIELNGTLYECATPLAELLEYLRLENVRVKVRYHMRPKPLVGYIQRRAKVVHHGQAARPVVVYNRRCRVGRWLDEEIIEHIEYSNKQVGGDIYSHAEGALIEFDLPLKSLPEGRSAE